jgi:Ca2+-binding EF-hand superfamily protein
MISVPDLKKIMINMGTSLTEEEVNDMIREADHDRDGRINYH